jgi:hypothetical protein
VKLPDPAYTGGAGHAPAILYQNKKVNDRENRSTNFDLDKGQELTFGFMWEQKRSLDFFRNLINH